MPDTKPDKPLTEQDMKNAMEAIGRRLALLLDAAPLPEEKKAQIIETLPFMNLEQIDQLSSILEEAVKGSTGDVAKNELAAKLQAIAQEYGTKRAQIEKDASEELDAIEAELEAAEK
jgi:hypothetical protein